MHWRPGYLVPSVWGSTSGLPTEEERRALLSIVVAIPGYLLSRHRSFSGQWLFLCTPFGSAFLSAAALASFISVVIGICGAGALNPGGASALPARPDTGARSCPDAVSPAWRSFAACTLGS